MPKFSQASLDKLRTCHPELQLLFNTVVQFADCTIIEGQRGKEAQDLAFREGRTELQWPNGKHNGEPAMAVDVAPYHKGINWTKLNNFYYFAGMVMGVANMLYNEGKMTHKVRYGGDWKGDEDVTNETFVDAVHYELI